MERVGVQKDLIGVMVQFLRGQYKHPHTLMAWCLEHMGVHCERPLGSSTWNRDQSPNVWQLYCQGMPEQGGESVLVMIEAQKAATEGTHVAVPEDLVPEAV